MSCTTSGPCSRSEPMRILLVVTLLGLIAAAGAVAQEAPIRLEKSWVRRAPAMPDARPGAESNAGGYVTIVNRGTSPDGLVGATGARVELKPGSYHLMLIGLKRALQSGQTVTLTLRFERAGALTTHAAVR